MSLLPSPTALAPVWRVVRSGVRIVGGLVLLAWSLILVAWLVLNWAILPRIDEWRPELERLATRSLGAPVQIGKVSVESHGWIPRVQLQQVVLRDAQGREALRLDSVSAAVSAASLWHLQLRFEQLLIDRPTLEIRRDAQGHIFVAGLEVSGPASADRHDGADWFFSQPEFVIRQGRVRWIDEQRQAGPLELEAVDLVLRNGSALGSRRHEWRLDASLPAALGERVSLRGRFTHPLLGRAGELERWSGSLYADLPQADVRPLRQYLDLPFDLNEGAGALRLWADMHEGAVTVVTADLGLAAVSLRLDDDLPPLALERLQGRISAERRKDGYAIAAKALSFRTMPVITAAATPEASAPLEWPASDFSLAWRHDAARQVTGGELKADRLDLAILARLAERLPLGAAMQARLAELAPQGVARNLDVRWTGAPEAPATYKVQGRLEALGLAAQALDAEAIDAHHAGRPGIRNADVDFSATEQGGTASLRLSQGALEFPGVFADPAIPVDQLQARLAWSVARPRRLAADAPPLVELRIDEARFANADAQGHFQATWRTGAQAAETRLPGVLDITGQLTRADATRTWRYLPTAIPEDVRDYVRRAVIAGKASKVDFRAKGNLHDFPFADPKKGEFRIASQVEDASFAYVPPEDGHEAAWPAFTQVKGELVFDRLSMQIRKARARVYGVELGNVQGGIADLSHSVLAIDGTGRGPLADLLRYAQSTPVNHWTNEDLGRARGSGEAQLRLALRLPLADLGDRQRQRQRELGRQRFPVQPRHALAGQDARRGRVFRAWLRDPQRRHPGARRRGELRGRFPEGRHAEVLGPGSGHGRGPAPGARIRALGRDRRPTSAGRPPTACSSGSCRDTPRCW